MKLRRRRATKGFALVQQSEFFESEEEDDLDLEPETAAAAINATEDEDDEYDVRVESLPAPKRKKRKGSNRVGRPKKLPPPKMELVELVMREMGRRDIFCTQSLKALRQTCKSFKTLVDEVVGLSTNIVVRNKAEMQDLLQSRLSIDRMETFYYQGNSRAGKPFEISDATAFLLMDPPRLREVALDHAGCALDVLVHAPFPHLTSLSVKGISKSSKAIEMLGRVHAWPLRELTLEGSAESAKQLAPALVRFPGLQFLSLEGPMDISGKFPPGTFSADSFPNLEVLNLDVFNATRLGLIGQTPTLPSLRQVVIKFNNPGWGAELQDLVTKLQEAPWLQQLTVLGVIYHARRFADVAPSLVPLMTGLHGGSALKELLIDWEITEALMASIDLPQLTSLALNSPRSMRHSSAMAALAHASIPNLTSLHISADRQSLAADSMAAFAVTLPPKLKSFTLREVDLKSDDVKTLALRVLPQLEELALKSMWPPFCEVIKNELPEEMTWPALRKLEVSHQTFAAVLKMAQRFPNLTHLHVSLRNDTTEHPTEELFADARKSGAWPALQELHLVASCWDFTSDVVRERCIGMVKKTWPSVDLFFT